MRSPTEAGASPADGSALPPLAAEPALVREAACIFLAGLGLLLTIGVSISNSASFGWTFLPAATFVYVMIVAAAFVGLRHHHHRRFGAPNIVTTIRAVVTALFAGFLLETGRIDGEPREPWAWIFAAIALGALLLDGVDGYLARKLSLSSTFGARYDMEVDALLILLLSALAFGLGKAGPLVLAVGLMRYAFVAAQKVRPWLAAELPPSFRRKAVCVLQAAVLGAIITPAVVPPVSNLLALAAVAALGWSFAVDIGWLHRRRRAAG